MESRKQSHQLATMIADGEGPVLVSFYNDNCINGVCGTQNAYLEKLSQDLIGTSARFEQVDLDQSPELVEKYQISTLPSALLFVEGELHTRLSGLTDPGVLACAVLQHVEDGAAVMARSRNICPVPHIAA